MHMIPQKSRLLEHNMNQATFQNMQSQATPPQPASQSPASSIDTFQAHQIILRNLSTQPPMQGWQSTVQVQYRGNIIFQIFSQLRLLQSQLDLECQLGLVIRFEARAFTGAPDMAAYDHLCKKKLADIHETRTKQSAAMQQQVNMQTMAQNPLQGLGPGLSSRQDPEERGSVDSSLLFPIKDHDQLNYEIESDPIENLSDANRESKNFSQSPTIIVSRPAGTDADIGGIDPSLRIAGKGASPSSRTNIRIPKKNYGVIVAEAAGVMWQHIDKNCSQALIGKTLFFRNAKATVGSTRGISFHDILTPDDWEHLDAEILARRSDREPDIQVNIYCDFIALRNRREGAKSFANTKCDEMITLERRAFTDNDTEYFSRIDLKLIASRQTIHEIVAEDTPAGTNDANRENFVNLIHDEAPVLFAMCVYAQLGMDCLKTFLDNGHRDETTFLEDKDKCHSTCSRKYKNFLKWQGSFRAAEFNTPGEHQDLHDKVVVPLQYYPKTQHEDGIFQESPSTSGFVQEELAKPKVKERSRCGSGAFSDVYRVKLDQDHHRLSDDRTKPFALKEFKDKPQRRGKDFRQELDVLKALRKFPHEHIVTHLATWTQHDRYFMLFPYATCNLRNYMMSWTFDPSLPETVIWLLGQFLGLADALREIHNLSDISAPQARLTVPAKKSAWHHDLKPANILFFSTQDISALVQTAGEGTFSIADFGAAKINTLRSVSINTKSPNGTPDYEAPEQKTLGRTSRPYDVWSLGCVFLELLVWALLGPPGFKDFHRKRFGKRDPSDTIEDNAFWQTSKGDSAELRTAVKDQIRELKRESTAGRQQPFDDVLQLTEKMLNPNSQSRIDALNVWNSLDLICKQARTVADEDNQSTFIQRHSIHVPGPRTPSPQPFEQLIAEEFTTSPISLHSPIDRRRSNSPGSSKSNMS
ncbi:MAG: hypothetical protein Q9198_001477 [Flavoplaca austrocitrina]